MNAQTALASSLALIGVTTQPSALIGGFIWALVFYLVFSIVQKRTGFWVNVGGVFLTLIVALFLSMMYHAIPYVADMPVKAAMGFAGILVPIAGPTMRALA